MSYQFEGEMAIPLENPYDETYVVCEKKTKAIYLKHYISHQERKEITETLGDAAVILFEYYTRMASVPQPVITDALAAASLAWTERKVRRYRQALTKAGWYTQMKFKLSNGKQGMAYYVGKAAVATSEDQHNSNQ